MDEFVFEYTDLDIEFLINNTFIPPFQRVDNDMHLENIYNGILEYYNKYNKIFIPGIITLCKVENNFNKMLLIDGQHRIKCLEKFYKENKVEKLKIRCDIYKLNNLETAKLLYNIINNTKKVDLYYGNINPYILPELQRFFKNKWGEYCSNSYNPKNLNINLNKLCKKIELSNIITKLYDEYPDIEIVKDKLFNRIIKLNQYYSSQNFETFLNWGIDISKYSKFIKSNNTFYLGLWRHYEWIDKLDYNPNCYDNIDHSLSTTMLLNRKKIPKQVREQLWKRYFNFIEGECYCCSKTIKITDFDCGHIISVKNNGNDSIDNLKPICRQCNLDMGILNLEDYKKYLDFFNQ